MIEYINPLSDFGFKHLFGNLSKLLKALTTHVNSILILEEHAILEKITPKSTKNQEKIKIFWSLISKSLELG